MYALDVCIIDWAKNLCSFEEQSVNLVASKTDLTLINFEKYSEAADPHMQIRRRMFGACAARTQILCRETVLVS